MLVRAKTAPAAAGQFTWDDTEQVIEVPDVLGHELVHVAAGAAFAEVLPTVAPRRPPGRPRKVVEE